MPPKLAKGRESSISDSEKSSSDSDTTSDTSTEDSSSEEELENSQHNSKAAKSPNSSHHAGREPILRAPTSFFNEQEKATLRSYVPAFKEGSKPDKQELIDKIVSDLTANGNLNAQSILRRKVVKYMGAHNRNLEKMLPWRKPSIKTLTIYEYGDEIRQIIVAKHGLKPGDPAFIGKYSMTVKEFYANLPDDKKEYLRGKQAEWKAFGPPADKRRRVAEKSLASLILNFSQKLYWETGARVLVLAGYRGEGSDIMWGTYDYNETIGSRKVSFPKFFPGYSKAEMLGKFKEYLEDNLTDHENNDSAEGKATSTPLKSIWSNRPLPSLLKNQWGEPVLPKNLLKGEKQKDQLDEWKGVVCAWLSGFYNLAAGTTNRSIPWAAVISSPADYFDLKYWPAAVTLKEPSKLRKHEIEALYAFWSEREKLSETPAFCFHHVQHSDRTSTVQAVDWRARRQVQRPTIESPPADDASQPRGRRRARDKKRKQKKASKVRRTEAGPSVLPSALEVGQATSATIVHQSGTLPDAQPTTMTTPAQGPPPYSHSTLNQPGTGTAPPPATVARPTTNLPTYTIPPGLHSMSNYHHMHPARISSDGGPLQILSDSQHPGAALTAWGANMAPSDAGNLFKALNIVSQLFNPNAGTLGPGFLSGVPPSGHPAPPVIDPSLLPPGYPYQAYPTQGPNDAIPPGCYPVPELPGDATQYEHQDGSTHEIASSSKPKNKKRKVPDQDAIASLPRLRATPSPQKKKWAEFEIHSDFKRLKRGKDGDDEPKDTKRKAKKSRRTAAEGEKGTTGPSDRSGG